MARILVCGGREFDDWALMLAVMDQALRTFGAVTVIEGEAKGADFLARTWAKYRLQEIEAYPADWRTHGREAGRIRNTQMLEEGKPDMVVAFPGGYGTNNMIMQAQLGGFKVIRVP